MKKYKNRIWLNGQYWKNELSAIQIGKLCGCNDMTIRNWLKRLNIKTRSRSEANHLRQANHCDLSNKARQWIDGELLGDGCLYQRSKYSARFSYASKYLEYINYVSEILESFGIKQAGKIHKRYHKKYNCYTYGYCSLDYSELLLIKQRWYPKGYKIIPRDLRLTPRVLRQEMIGDGNLSHRSGGKPYIRLATNGFSVEDVNWLVNQLNKLSFKSTRHSSENTIHISTKSTKQFLNYIGKSPVKCYQYKFNY